ncbi:MAG: energy-coupling factor ABC transporter ATP-binding protein [Candidatus Adiutrix sp.]|nr:energy-coupling factor ABC transporter ATP-binding protein [Candidatus Adiutrix sp.]
MISPSSEILIELQGIDFAYPGGPPVLENFSLTLAGGERLGLSGANGCGKTTLLYLIMGLLKPGRGSIEIFGRARREEKDFQEIRPRLGFVFQDANDQLFCPTVADDLAFGPLNLGRSRAEAHAIVHEVLSALELEGFENRVTYDLSGGQKKLVAIGTALALRPQLLILDEPTTGLDEITVARLEHFLLSCGLPCLMVSHDREFLARVSTRRLSLAGAGGRG